MPIRRLSLVSRVALRRIVRTAVDRSLVPGERGEIADRLACELARAIHSEGRSVQGMSRSDVLHELELANHELVQARDRARAELEELQRRAEIQRRQLAEMHDALVRVVDVGAQSREELALTQVDRVFARAKREALSLDALRVEVDELVIEAARRERRELLDGLCAERDRQIEVLERRLAKLKRSLELSEAALRELAARKSLDEGLASIYRTVQGLADDEPGADRKRQLLADIFRANVELRRLREQQAAAERVLQAAAV